MKQKNGLKTFSFLVFVMTASAMLLTLVSEMTKEIRMNHDRLALASSICLAAGINDIKTEKGLLEFFASGKIIESKDFRIIDFREKNFSAVVFSGPGLWDRIQAVLCISPGLTVQGFVSDKLLGIQILQQRETPGLGGRIEEKSFTDQFSGFPLNQGSPKIVSGRPKSSEIEIDGITGASMTCRFLQDSISNCLEKLTREYGKVKDEK